MSLKSSENCTSKKEGKNLKIFHISETRSARDLQIALKCLQYAYLYSSSKHTSEMNIFLVISKKQLLRHFSDSQYAEYVHFRNS